MKRLAAVLACLASLVFLASAGSLAGRESGRKRPNDAEAARLAGATARVAAARAASRDAAAARVSRLLAALWPLRVEGLLGGREALDWAEADRRYVWTRALLEAARAAGEVQAAFPDGAARRMGGTTREPVTASVEPAGRSGPPADEPDAGGVPGDPPPGGLVRPVAGRVAAGFAPSGRPPRQGVVLAAPEGSPVVAAADGLVVFTGMLRGLGRVVILSHDGSLHTIYACLASADAAVGDAVPRGAPLGRSGLCGVAKGPGVYFELRFREKALNPAEWFAARR